eukprot:6806-Heterococcus_DN1.PRE.2
MRRSSHPRRQWLAAGEGGTCRAAEGEKHDAQTAACELSARVHCHLHSSSSKHARETLLVHSAKQQALALSARALKVLLVCSETCVISFLGISIWLPAVAVVAAAAAV